MTSHHTQTCAGAILGDKKKLDQAVYSCVVCVCVCVFNVNYLDLS